MHDTPAERTKFGQAMVVMAEVFGETLSELRLGAYFESLRRFDLAQVEGGIVTATARAGQKFMPKPGEIAEAIEGPGASRALLAWNRVERAMANVGSYESVDFQDSALHAVLDRLGGWVAVCDWREFRPLDMSFKAKDFMTLYDLLSTRDHGPRIDYLPGRVQLQRGKDGWLKRFGVEPRIIGLDGRWTGETTALPDNQQRKELSAPDDGPVDVKVLVARVLEGTPETY